LFISDGSWPFGEDPFMVCSCTGGETWLQTGVVLLKKTGGDIGCLWRGSIGRHGNFLKRLLRPPAACFVDMKIDRVRKEAVKLISLADDKRLHCTYRDAMKTVMMQGRQMRGKLKIDG
jgi:hypothetical protein